MDSRQQFEEKYPLPEGMYFDNEQNSYAGTKDFWLWCARWESWQASRESMVVELPRGFSTDYCNGDAVFDAEEIMFSISKAGAKYK